MSLRGRVGRHTREGLMKMSLPSAAAAPLNKLMFHSPSGVETLVFNSEHRTHTASQRLGRTSQAVTSVTGRVRSVNRGLSRATTRSYAHS
jgi:hypothetical protein